MQAQRRAIIALTYRGDDHVLLPRRFRRCSKAATAASRVGMPTFTFGAGVLAEAGDNARELACSRVALFTDPAPRRRRARRQGARVAARRRASTCAVYDEVAIEPTDARSRRPRASPRDGTFDGYVSVGGGSVIDTCKAANLYATHPAEFMTYVNAPIGAGQRVPGPLKPHIACPTTSGTGSETTGIAIFNLRALNAKTGIISRRLIPDRRARSIPTSRARCRRTSSRRPASTA